MPREPLRALAPRVTPSSRARTVRTGLACVGLVASTALGSACGSSPQVGFEEVEAGGAGGQGAAGAAGGSTVGGGAGAPSLAEAWPTTDPDPGKAPGDGPGFTPPMQPASPTCSGKQGAKGDRVFTVPSNGLPRTSLVHVPPSYDPTKPTMVVLNFHGFSSDALQQSVLSRMNAAADAHGFIAVHPYGVLSSWNAGKCCGQAWVDGVDDVAFVKKLLVQLGDEYCVDARHVHATGMSNGGFLAHRLACEMADTIASIAPVAGVMGLAFDACKPARPVPVLQFHGTSDPLVPYDGGNPVLDVGLKGALDFPSVTETMQLWRDRDACQGAAEPIFAKGDTTCVRWGACQGQSEVVLCTIEGGGHTWPGGVPIPLGKTSDALSATDTMASFFAAHPLP